MCQGTGGCPMPAWLLQALCHRANAGWVCSWWDSSFAWGHRRVGQVSAVGWRID